LAIAPGATADFVTSFVDSIFAASEPGVFAGMS
jgi:hypothetical protein